MKKNYILNRSILTGDEVVYLGNSITAGVGASPQSNRWTSRLCAAKGWIEVNNGVSGMTLIKSTPQPTSTIMDRFYYIPNYEPKHRYLINSFGVNDVGMNFESWTSELFNTQYRLLIANAISKGWPKQKIICNNIYYVNSPTVWNLYNYYNIPTPATEQRYQEFRAVVSALSDIATVKDSYKYFKDTVGNSGLADDLHPNILGHKTNADYFINNLP